MTFDPPLPPVEPAGVACDGDCGSRFELADGYHLTTRRGDAVLCLQCALDALHDVDPLRSTQIGSRELIAAATVYEDAARACRRLAQEPERVEQ